MYIFSIIKTKSSHMPDVLVERRYQFLKQIQENIAVLS